VRVRLRVSETAIVFPNLFLLHCDVKSNLDARMVDKNEERNSNPSENRQNQHFRFLVILGVSANEGSNLESRNNFFSTSM